MKTSCSKDAIWFRMIDREFEARLHEINRLCPIQADFTFYFAREPNFFAWPDQCFDEHQYIGIFEQDSLVGYGMRGLLKGHVGNEVERYFYLGDWRLVPDARGKRLGPQSAEHLGQSIPEDIRLGFGLVKRGNRPVEHLVKTFVPKHWSAQHLCSFNAANLFLFWRPRQPKGLEITRAAANDITEMASVMKKAWAEKLFAPVMSEDSLRQEISRLSDFDISQYFLAKKHGRMVGLVGVWDAHEQRRITVLEYSKRGEMVKLAYSLIARLHRNLAPMPMRGSSFRTLTTRHIAVLDQDPSVLRALLIAIARDFYGKGYQMIHVGFAGKDPLATAVRYFPRQSFESELFAFQRNARPHAVGSGGHSNPWIDLAKI